MWVKIIHKVRALPASNGFLLPIAFVKVGAFRAIEKGVFGNKQQFCSLLAGCRAALLGRKFAAATVGAR
jgi:hypothetical protein